MADGSETIALGDVSVRFLVEGDESNGTAAAFEVLIKAGGKVPAAHFHDAYEETIDLAAVGAVMRRHGLTPAPAG